ncbi:MAG: acyl-CoA dehydrogenase family protein [Desulfobacteraceae bacterium]|jgi:alkylation response protein AidB-like acyl-CoA dehydrogenase
MNDIAYKGLDDESRQMVVETVRQLSKKMLSRQKVLEWDKHEIFPEEVIRQMLGPEIGLQLLFIPEAYGGMDGGARDCCAVTREMAKICLGVGTAFFAIQLGSDPILVGATHEQKEKWLGRIAEGTTLVAYAVTEPEAGSNLAALKTKAEPVTDESGKVTGYKITGTKQFISTGGYADLITVLANTPEGPSFFVVEKGMEGFTQHKGEEKHGIRASNTSPLTLDNVYVPAENLIGGEPGKGLKQANQVFGYTRLMVAAMGLGAGEAALEIAMPYAKERIQFGSPLSEKQGYTHKLIVPNAVRMTAAQAYIDEVALMLDGSAHDLQVEGAIAKYFATESADKAANDCIQALGGYGYICEFGVEKIKRDVKITCIYEGTSEIQQSIISTFRWKTSRKTKGQFYGKIVDEMAALDAQADDVGGRYYGLAAKALNKAIDFAHNSRLTRQQAVMFALSDMMTHVEVGAALARKAVQLAKAGDPQAEKTKAMARVFAGEVAQVVGENALKIATGTGVTEPPAMEQFLADIGYQELLGSRCNWVVDMDKIADIILER